MSDAIAEAPPVAAPAVPAVQGREFSMPGGYRDRAGMVHKTVVIQEMTGVDEENISNPNIAKNGGKIITALLANCVKMIGKYKVTPEMIQSLVTGDRDFLMVQLRIVTIGKDFEQKIRKLGSQ